MKCKFYRFLFAVISLLFICPLFGSVKAYTQHDEAACNRERPEMALYEASLFKGTGTNADGTPIFDTLKAPTRGQAAIMFVRMLGKENEALGKNYPIPFTDVSDTAAPYVGFLYANGLANGISQTNFGSAQNITKNQFLTFSLRALGYQTPSDFTVATANELGDQVGLTHCFESYPSETGFTRGDMAVISLNALSTYVKGTSIELAHNVNLEFLTYADYKKLFTLSLSGRDNSGVPLYNAKLNESYDSFISNGVNLMTWYSQRFAQDKQQEDPNHDVSVTFEDGAERVGYAFGYPNYTPIARLF